jgi:hypothetical protein
MLICLLYFEDKSDVALTEFHVLRLFVLSRQNFKALQLPGESILLTLCPTRKFFNLKHYKLSR